MRRHALLFGNTHALAGVKPDIRKFDSFLRSETGGLWYDAEIETCFDITRSDLMSRLDRIKKLDLDYLIILFSGHGGQKRETEIELNKQGERVSTSELLGYAARQLTIFDCCRSYEELEGQIIAYNAYPNVMMREKYEARIMTAVPQQVVLYSCSPGQVSYDTTEGGVYLQNFLRAAHKFTSPFKLVGEAHMEATEPTVNFSRAQRDGLQNPEAVLTKGFTARQLIISLRPGL
jgi:hypothetical protein